MPTRKPLALVAGVLTELPAGDDIARASVGLGNADNTSDASKPISTLTQEALNLKANTNNPTFTGVATIAGAANTLSLAGASATNPVVLRATGADTNISIDLVTKGTGALLVNGLPLAGGGITAYTYANRATLRAAQGTGFAYVEGLGLFQWVPFSTEPDDDETAFAATGGAWELAATDPDYVFADHILRFDALQRQITRNAAKTLYATFGMSITALNSVSVANFVVPVVGAVPGDSVLVTPGNSIGVSENDQSRLNFVGWVSAHNTVTVSLRNPSLNVANVTPSTWAVAVINR